MKIKIKEKLLTLFFICIAIVSSTFANEKILLEINEIEQKVDEHVKKYLGITTPGVAIAIVKDGKIIFSKGYGFANLEKQIRVDVKKSVFEWGSITKLFTFTAVMQLVEQGKIDLDEDIKNYLPDEFKRQLKVKELITMRDLMNHSAGFSDYAFSTIGNTLKHVIVQKDALIRDQPEQYFKVGTASAYSNYGAGLAGYIVENISNQTFADYQREHIFKKLGMKNISAHISCEDNKNILSTKAEGYIRDGKDGFKNGGWSYCPLVSAGSINGSVEDLALFAIALTKDNKLFNNKETLEQMLSSSYENNGEMIGTAHGFFEFSKEPLVLGHGGNTLAFSSNFVIAPEENFGICILTNAKGEMDINFGLQELLFSKSKEIKTPAKDLPSSKVVEGNYVQMERQEGSFLNFLQYTALYKIKFLEENKISMSYGSYKAIYKQIESYKYELEEYNSPLFTYAFPYLEFKMDGNIPKQIMLGKGRDLSALPKNRTMFILFSSLIIFIVSNIFFIFGILIFLIKKRELNTQVKKFNSLHFLLMLIGFITLLNNYICVFRVFADVSLSFSSLKPHILLNYFLAFLAIILGSYSIILSRAIVVSRFRRSAFIASLVLLFLLFMLLVLWNFFSIVG